MSSVNKVFLLGNLTRDPELRSLDNGSVCKFGIATNRKWKDASGAEREDVCFVDVTVFGRMAETCNEYLRKGRQAHIEGRLQLDQWDDKDTGQKRYKLYVVAERVTFVGNRDGNSGGGQGSSQGSNQNGGGQRQSSQSSQRPAPNPNEGVDFDDIPF